MITELLIKFGLTQNEALVYGVLLSHSPAGATYIAKKCSLARSSVYTSINSLMSKGLVGTSYKNEVKQFIAEDCDALNQYFEKEKNTLEERISLFNKEKDNLERLRGDWLKIPQIIYFEGQEGLKKTYFQMIREVESGSTMYVMRDEFVWHPSWHFIFENTWHKKIKNIKSEKDIKTKLLVNDSETEKKHQKFYQDKKGLKVKYLPKNYSLKKFALYVNNDTVSLLSFEKNNMIGLRIVNKNLAENFINTFEALWKRPD